MELVDRNDYSIPVKLNIILFKMAGFWRVENSCLQIISKYFMIFFFFIYAPAFTLPLIYDLYSRTDDLVHWINIFFHVFPIFEILTKTARFLRDYQRIERLVNTMVTVKHFCPKYRRQKEYLDASKQISDKTTLTVVGFCALTGVAYGLVPFTDSKTRILPIDVQYHFDIQKSPYFQIVYCYQVPMIFILLIQAGLVMTFVTSLMSFVCAQIKILKESFQFMQEFAAIDLLLNERKEYLLNTEEYICYDQFDSKFLWRQVCVNLKYSIQHHKEILKFLKEIQDLFGVNFLIDIITSGVVIGCTCVVLTNGATLTIRSLTIFMVCAVALIQLAINCYFGNNIIEEGRTISHALYFSNWMDAPIHIRKMIIFTMENSKKTCQIIAGLAFNLSLSTLLNILKKTYSLIAVLQDVTQ